ncbi:MAG: PAS domain S-box protein [Polyangiales bacterium]
MQTRLAIPVVFLSADADERVVERVRRAEPAGHVIRPSDPLTLRPAREMTLEKDRVERQLRQCEAKYRAVVESAHDAVITADAQGRIVEWNPAASALFGYADEEAIGRPLTDLMPARRRAWHPTDHVERLSDRLDEMRRPKEMAGLRKDGNEFPLEASFARWTCPEGEFVTSFIRDISERRAADALLRLQSAALDAVANGIIITDGDHRIEWSNPAFSAMTGYSPEETLGKVPYELLGSVAVGGARLADIDRCIEQRGAWSGELLSRRKDQSTYTEEVTITLVRSVDDASRRYIGVMRDVTDERRLRQQFLQAQKMEVVGRLAGGVAHDFNNLLTIINGASELAMMDLGADDPVRLDLQEIREAAERAARLTRQLLAFSRKQLVKPVVLKVSAQVKTSGAMLRRLIGEDVSLVIESPPDDAGDHVLVDQGQFEQLLMNLVVNACDAMPTGGALTIQTRLVDVGPDFAASHHGVTAGAHVMLAVSDTGVGMTDEVREHIFEPFYTTKGHGKGTGLGLATVYGIVAQGGGCVIVESAPGQGSTFKVYLPRISEQADVVPRRSEHPARGAETILLVEDESGLRDLATRMLRSVGYDVLCVSGGEEALAVMEMRGCPVDLLFTDVVMPGMSGPALAARLTERYPEMRVLFASGYTEDGKVRGDLVDDTRGFLAKPYSISQLTRMVRQLLDAPRRAARSEAVFSSAW